MPSVAVVGGGPAGLIAAETLATAGVRVVVYEQNATVGRKFLLAGRGGLNLTHSEEPDTFLTRYRPAHPQLLDAVRAFPPAELRAWADGLGAATFVGSSGRVFPAAFRAAPLLRGWLARLRDLQVELVVRRRVDEVGVVPDGFEAMVLGLGGATWPRTGADGGWVAHLPHTELRPANVGFTVAWSAMFSERFARTPFKDVGLRFGDVTSRGDAMVTADGIEGGAVYAVSAELRDALTRGSRVVLELDARPDISVDALTARLAKRRAKSTVTSWLTGAGVAPVVVSLLREATANSVPDDPANTAALLKTLPIPITGVQSMERAISTAGGVPFDAVDENFMLRERPGVFVAGEMLDWEAPTGGYLLQGCFATGIAAARGVLRYLDA